MLLERICGKVAKNQKTVKNLTEEQVSPTELKIYQLHHFKLFYCMNKHCVCVCVCVYVCVCVWPLDV